MIASTKKRIAEIQQMMFEMASGNFFYRMELTNRNDSIEGLVTAVNMLSEEIQETLPYADFSRKQGTRQHLVQMCFLLDSKGNVEMTNEKSCTLMGCTMKDIIGKPFNTFLKPHSKDIWGETMRVFLDKHGADTSIDLEFNTKKKLLIADTCHLTTLKGGDLGESKTLVTLIMHSKVRVEKERELKNKVTAFESSDKNLSHASSEIKQNLILTSDDVQKLTLAHEIIKNNPEKSQGTLKQFARRLGTNEFKLKNGFKELYGTTVHRFVIDERLRRSTVLIQFSEFSLKRIAHLMGFKTYPHFSKTFKSRYGYTAGQLRKRSLAERKKGTNSTHSEA